MNSEKKTVLVNVRGIEEEVSYDKLVIATGAKSFVPPVEGVKLPGVFKVRTPDDAEIARNYIEKKECSKAVVVGGGFIGLEVAENLMKKGLAVTVIDMADQIMPNIFDKEFADYISRNLRKKGLKIITGTELKSIIKEVRIYNEENTTSSINRVGKLDSYIRKN